jgi:MFS family permease
VAGEQARDTGGAGARLTLVPLRRNRDFVLLQTGQTLSTIGSESTAIAYPLLVLALTHSPAQAGIVGFARIVPWALFGMVAGVAADRFNRKHLMIVSDVVRVFAALSIVLALAFDRLTVLQIAVVAFVEGALYVFFNIAELGALRSIVPGRQLPAAAAAEQARWSTVFLVAPPLGGALFGLGRSLPFIANAFSYLFSLASLLAMRTPFQEERVKDEASVRDQLAEGLRWLWSHRFFRACALLFSWVNLVYEALFLVLIVVGRQQGLSGGEIGGLIAVFGVCSLLGSLAAPRIIRLLSMRTLIIGGFWLQLGFAAFLLKPDVFVLLAGSVPVALFGPAVNAAVIGYRTAVVPDRLAGRVGGVARTIALCTAAFGPLSAGLLLHWFSPRETIACYAALMLLLCVLGTLNPSIRNAPSLKDLDDLPVRPSASPAEAG